MARKKTQQRPEVKELERGNIYFFYRPRVSKEGSVVRSLNDVQRSFMVLSPKDKKRYRLVVLPKKQLPDVDDTSQKNWGFVAKVGDRPDAVEDELDKGAYETKTRRLHHQR